MTHGQQKWAKMGQKQRTKLMAALQAKESALWAEGKLPASLLVSLLLAFLLAYF